MVIAKNSITTERSRVSGETREIELIKDGSRRSRRITSG
jgi:hypothetical protein